KVVLTPRTSWKDKDNNLHFGKRLPVGLDDLSGCVIEEHETLLSGMSSDCVYEGKTAKGYVFEELLKVTTAKPLVMWKDNPFGDYAAATANQYGDGTCWYLGSSFEEELLDELFDEILK
ncbi:MAG: beta-galactosidase trimerization domain-containing protein, partial [Erysipelotrichaceae bacterium]|nr:beta-galactosidase trimerization domain-containing protein [Erysipelotrichaceae bacterium]